VRVTLMSYGDLANDYRVSIVRHNEGPFFVVEDINGKRWCESSFLFFAASVHNFTTVVNAYIKQRMLDMSEPRSISVHGKPKHDATVNIKKHNKSRRRPGGTLDSIPTVS
jgi:hypothetical protein